MRTLAIALFLFTGTVHATFIPLAPAPYDSTTYVYAGSEATAFDVAGNPTGACIYWSDPVRIGGRAGSVTKFAKGPCTWALNGTLLTHGPVAAVTVVAAFTPANRGVLMPDGNHIAFATDGTDIVGRSITPVEGFVFVP
jgi:hypothetical protein